MNTEKSLLTFMVLIIFCNASDPTTLGTNLLINHDFSMPNISASGVPQQLFNRFILGWNCSAYCEIVDCYRLTYTSIRILTIVFIRYQSNGKLSISLNLLTLHSLQV